MPIIDESMHAAVVPMDGKLRLVGTAEFAGFDRTISKARVDNLRELLGRILPKTAEHLQKIEGETWVGFRPMSADGVPFIGPLVDDRVFVNAGHGHLGWTLAMGSAHLLADQIDKKKPIIPFEAYLPERRRSGWTLPFRFPC
jgi:D-amino-acid dehydrogenase